MRLRRRRIAGDPRSLGADPNRPRRGFAGLLKTLTGRQVTPARGLAFVALAATITLGASQFSNYHAVQVGAPEYRGVESVAPAPEVDKRMPRSAHGVSVLAIAGASLLVTVFAVTKNWRLARLLLFFGAAVVAISVGVDLHQGLREGLTGVAYQGARAVLLAGFWVQLWSGVTLMVVGPLLAAQLHGERRARRAGLAGEMARPDVAAGSLSPSTRSSGVEGART